MLYDKDIAFKDKKYKNIFYLLDSSINDRTLKPLINDEKSILLNILNKKKISINKCDSSLLSSN